jgi:hypothetical protein
MTRVGSGESRWVERARPAGLAPTLPLLGAARFLGSSRFGLLSRQYLLSDNVELSCCNRSLHCSFRCIRGHVVGRLSLIGLQVTSLNHRGDTQGRIGEQMPRI